MANLKNKRFDSILIPLLAIVLLASLITLACSSGSSPTEPTAPAPGQNAEAAGNDLAGGTVGAEIRVEKSTNGEDADDATGPEIPIGDPVVWTYMVTNTGSLNVSGITLNDNQIGGIKCPKSTLTPKESMECSAEGVAEKGQYRNVASVDGTASDKSAVHDKDRSHYIGVDPGKPNINIEKSTNGEDADDPTGPEIPVGDPVTWTYEVTNTGDVPLTGIVVTDNQIGTITCPQTELEPGESMTCTAEGIAQEGQYRNVGSVNGTAPDKSTVHDKDRSHYVGKKEQQTGDQGCSHGYWKNHLGSWGPTGYSPQETIVSVFASAATWPDIANATLHEGLQFGGGSGVEGAARNLMKQAVGTLLNAAHPSVNFPRTEGDVINSVNNALDSNNRDTILSLAGDFDDDNNLGCPLN